MNDDRERDIRIAEGLFGWRRVRRSPQEVSGYVLVKAHHEVLFQGDVSFNVSADVPRHRDFWRFASSLIPRYSTSRDDALDAISAITPSDGAAWEQTPALRRHRVTLRQSVHGADLSEIMDGVMVAWQCTIWNLDAEETVAATAGGTTLPLAIATALDEMATAMRRQHEHATG